MKAITNRMSGDEAALWTKLSTFSIDGPDTRLTFAARLARENGWHPIYTQLLALPLRQNQDEPLAFVAEKEELSKGSRTSYPPNQVRPIGAMQSLLTPLRAEQETHRNSGT